MKNSRELERKFRKQLWEKCILPNAQAIAEIAMTGAIAIAVFDPSDVAIDAAKQMGWDGKHDVFPMSAKVREDLVAVAQQLPDPVFRRWLTRDYDPEHPQARVFVVAQLSSMLMNFSPDVGWFEEPFSNAIGLA